MPLWKAAGSSLKFPFIAGEAINQYEVVYGDAAGGVGRVKKAVNTSAATSRVLGAATAGAALAATFKVMVGGQYTMTFTGGAPVVGDFGRPVFLSAVAGQVTLTPPVAIGSVVIRVGWLAGWGAANCLVNIAIGDQFQL